MRGSRLRPGDIGLLLHIVRLLVRWTLLRGRLAVPDLVNRFDAPGTANVKSLDVDRTVRLTRWLLRRVYTKRFCMPQSLILLHLLRRANYQAAFHLGVARKNDELVGHAWVDLDGRPFAERGDPRSRFSVVYSHPPPTSSSTLPTSGQTQSAPSC